MGIGFVLIVWVIILTILSFSVSLFITILYKIRKKNIPIHKFLKFYLLIPITAIYFFLAMTGVAIINEYVRGVDAGFGDGWRIPVGNGYNLCMIESTDQGYIMKNNCSGVPLVDTVISLSQNGNIVIGQHADKGLFKLNITTGEINPINSLPLHHPKLMSVGEFYSINRNSLADLMILMLFVAIPILWFARYWFKKSFNV